MKWPAPLSHHPAAGAHVSGPGVQDQVPALLQGDPALALRLQPRLLHIAAPRLQPRPQLPHRVARAYRSAARRHLYSRNRLPRLSRPIAGRHKVVRRPLGVDTRIRGALCRVPRVPLLLHHILRRLRLRHARGRHARAHRRPEHRLRQRRALALPDLRQRDGLHLRRRDSAALQIPPREA